MIELTRRITNKRRPRKRGPKQRYSVWRAEHNIREEARLERLCRETCNKFGLDIEDFYVFTRKNPWARTWEHIRIHRRLYPYNKAASRRFRSEEYWQTIDSNIKSYFLERSFKDRF